MSRRLPVSPAPGPLEAYASAFDDLFSHRSQRDQFRRYLEGLLLSSERNKTFTGLANTEPGVGATDPAAQRIQWFVSESTWEAEQINQRRLRLLTEKEATVPVASGVLIIDETGDRKWGRKTAHVGRQWLGSIGKTDNGIVSVSSLWADERVYYPIEVEPYTPASHFERGKADPAFRTKPQIALELVEQTVTDKRPFRAVVADSFYGENEEFKSGLVDLSVGYVLALKPSHCWWHREGTIGSVFEATQAAPWQADDPGAWISIKRVFRDGHEEWWWALEACAGPYGPEQAQRLVIVTTDPMQLPEQSTWYLTSNLPTPDSTRAATSTLTAADLAEVVRLYGLRIWVEQSYKQVKGTLGWADYQVRDDRGIRRHWQLVCCAFSFCWWALDQEDTRPMESVLDTAPAPIQVEAVQPSQSRPIDAYQREKKARDMASSAQLARGATQGPGLVGTVSQASTILASWVQRSSTCSTASVAG
jgi:SRSO17 transposase